MINPLIQAHPGDTLHYLYCVLDFLETLPNENPEGASLSPHQVLGFFWIVQCVKDALLFERERASTSPRRYREQVPRAARVARLVKGISHPRLRDLLLSDVVEAVDLCRPHRGAD